MSMHIIFQIVHHWPSGFIGYKKNEIIKDS